MVTGSSRGIGKAISGQLLDPARELWFQAGRKACQAVYEELKEEGYDVLCVPCHVGKRDQVENLIQKTVEKWGRLDSLICNAATNPVYGPLGELSDEAFDKIMEVNLKSTLWLSNLSAPHMIASGGGTIILMSSITAFVGTDKVKPRFPKRLKPP